MNEININLRNCFGIGKLEHNFKFNELQTNTFIIYAPNGTMKSSFARTFDLLSKGDSKSMPHDRVYDSRPPKHEIYSDDVLISKDSILVVNAEDNFYDSSNKISSFIASQTLKKRYDSIYLELENRKKEYLKSLKNISQSSDCEIEFINTFSQTPKQSFFELILKISKGIIPKPEIYNFKYNDIFDKKGSVIKFLDKNQLLLSDYLKNYEELLSNSKFFKHSNNSFGTYQANELLKSIEDNSFFEAGHRFTLNNKAEINSVDELKELLQNEIIAIVNNEKLKQSFEQVDKSIGANVELRSFKNAIENNNLLLVELNDYEKFRQKVWNSYVSRISRETLDFATFYESQKDEIESIIEKAKKEFSIWNNIIDTFNERFFVPFKIKLVNQVDVVLKKETANLEFDYQDSNENPIRKDKDSLLSILSKGEHRAYNILQLLFDVESRKNNNTQTLLILDDIADSFDYKNKYAIIEYIKELHQNPLFRLIILTHNFDFYRTVASRLSINRQSIYMVNKNEQRDIIFFQGGYINNIFSVFQKKLAKEKIFICIIPFLRNIIEYTEDVNSKNYNILTSCLHIKKDTYSITCNDILSLIQGTFENSSKQRISFGPTLIKDLIYKTSDELENEKPIDEILIENKITLSIAIRLKAEEFMFQNIPNSSNLTFTSNQTTELLDYYKQNSTDKNSIMLLERVNLMTPENIHVNAFMYEPIIDISVYHLIDLYKSIKKLF